jgi:hypothetical protein
MIDPAQAVEAVRWAATVGVVGMTIGLGVNLIMSARAWILERRRSKA